MDSAFSALSISFSGFTYAAARTMGSSEGFCFRMASASGSSPFSRAIMARVRRFGRYGRYRSSRTARVVAASIFARSDSSSLPWASMVPRMVSRRFSSPRRYSSRSPKLRSCWSSISPVCSFLYRAMKGMVFPSSISAATVSAISGFVLNSLASTIEISMLNPPSSDSCLLYESAPHVASRFFSMGQLQKFGTP